MGLKPSEKPAILVQYQGSQSNHYGIETFTNYSVPPSITLSQSNHYGIETTIAILKKVVRDGKVAIEPLWD